MSKASFEIRAMEACDPDLRAFKECFERNGTERRLEALRWQYADNPTGELLVDVAVSGSRVGAIYAVQPARVRVQGGPRLAAQSVDTLVDAEFRGQGLFKKMASSVYERARQRGVAFVYGFPNESSAPGFFGKLGWISLDPVPFLVRPLRTSFVASKLPLGRWLRRLPDLRLPVGESSLDARQVIRPLTGFGAEIDQLWEQFASNVTVAVDRSSTYLRWRLTKPRERYECLGLFEQDTLVAFCAYTLVNKHGGRIGYILELLHHPGRDPAGASLLVNCLGRLASSGADAVLAWNFRHSPNAKAYRRAGFVPLPERLRPIELHLGVCPLDESLAGVLSDRRNWYISYCDSDTV